jgi:hypothetical protein
MVKEVSFRRLILLAYTLDTNAILYYLKDDAKAISLLLMLSMFSQLRKHGNVGCVSGTVNGGPRTWFL